MTRDKVVTLKTKNGGRGKIPAPPQSLTAAGKEEWTRVAPVLVDRGTLAAETSAVLETYCSQFALVRACDEALQEQPMIITGGNGIPKPHPLLGTKNKAAATVLQLAKRLGLLPGQGLGKPAKGGGVDDPYARLGIR